MPARTVRRTSRLAIRYWDRAVDRARTDDEATFAGVDIEYPAALPGREAVAAVTVSTPRVELRSHQEIRVSAVRHRTP